MDVSQITTHLSESQGLRKTGVTLAIISDGFKSAREAIRMSKGSF